MRSKKYCALCTGKKKKKTQKTLACLPFSCLSQFFLIFNTNAKQPRYTVSQNATTRNIQWWAIAKSNAKLNSSIKLLLSSFSDVILYKDVRWSSDDGRWSMLQPEHQREARVAPGHQSETKTPLFDPDSSGTHRCCGGGPYPTRGACGRATSRTEQRCDVWNVVTRRQWVKEWRFTVRYIKILHWDHRQRDRRKVNSNADMWQCFGEFTLVGCQGSLHFLLFISLKGQKQTRVNWINLQLSAVLGRLENANQLKIQLRQLVTTGSRSKMHWEYFQTRHTC